MYLAKASEIVRREIFAEQNKFSGHFDRDSVVDSVPHCLVELVLMIEHGPDIKSMRCKCHAETGRLSVAGFLSLHTREDLHKYQKVIRGHLNVSSVHLCFWSLFTDLILSLK
jgi:hypothetical protein